MVAPCVVALEEACRTRDSTCYSAIQAIAAILRRKALAKKQDEVLQLVQEAFQVAVVPHLATEAAFELGKLLFTLLRTMATSFSAEVWNVVTLIGNGFLGGQQGFREVSRETQCAWWLAMVDVLREGETWAKAAPMEPFTTLNGREYPELFLSGSTSSALFVETLFSPLLCEACIRVFQTSDGVTDAAKRAVKLGIGHAPYCMSPDPSSVGWRAVHILSHGSRSHLRCLLLSQCVAQVLRHGDSANAELKLLLLSHASQLASNCAAFLGALLSPTQVAESRELQAVLHFTQAMTQVLSAYSRNSVPGGNAADGRSIDRVCAALISFYRSVIRPVEAKWADLSRLY